MMPSRQRHLSLSGVLDEALFTGGQQQQLREPMTHDSVNVLLTDLSSVGVRKLSSGEEPPTLEELEGGGSTPNDVRHFPPSPPPPTTRTGMSMSVPITQLDRSPHKLGHEEEQALAEYREALMYQRIVGFQQSRRRASTSGMMNTTMKEHQQTVPVLLRPRIRQHQHSEPHLSLVDMLSPSERGSECWSYLPSSSAPRFPVHHHHDNTNNPHSDDHDDDDDDHDAEEDGDHHHHDEVFELDL